MMEVKPKPTTDEEFRLELASYAEGLDVGRFYHAWRFLIILWRSVWWCSNVSWRRYYTTIWDKFARWIASAGRRSRDLATFIAVFSREAKLASVGANRAERQWIMELVALSYEEQRAILRQLREDTSLLVAFVREYQDRHKSESANGRMSESANERLVLSPVETMGEWADERLVLSSVETMGDSAGRIFEDWEVEDVELS